MKFAENLPTPTFSPVPSKTKETFNHQNPFNLDLNALSAYQKQKHNAGKIERRGIYQIIQRTMATKALETEGAEHSRVSGGRTFKMLKFFKVPKRKRKCQVGCVTIA
jgi:hypothetical protein